MKLKQFHKRYFVLCLQFLTSHDDTNKLVMTIQTVAYPFSNDGAARHHSLPLTRTT
jgi:hypothetical protein